ncbi:MAG: ABC transporter ATP-binding protein [Phycisphaerae bacterium]
MSSPVVRFSHVSKRFCLGTTHDSLRDLLWAQIGRFTRRGRANARRSMFWALQDVDFAVDAGRPVGIVGPNGAGKSTVLKLLAGILRADRGEVTVRGRLAALIEIGAGFHGDLTGRENIFLNGAILGMSRAEIRSKLDPIVAFAGLERFLDMPVKRYSSGMYARLGFSIAAHVDPDILLVDEVLSVGDAVFRLRCLDRMRRLVDRGTTLVFVTHNLDQMQSICPRAIVLCGGRCVYDGASPDAVGHYLNAMSRTHIARPTDVALHQSPRDRALELVSLRFLNEKGDEILLTRARAPISVELRFRQHRAIPRLVLEVNMRSSSHENLLSVNTGRDGLMLEGRVGEHVATLTLPTLSVGSGNYLFNARIWDAQRGTTELDTPFRFPLIVNDEGTASGVLCIDHRWSFTGPTTAESGAELGASANGTPACVEG